MDCGREPRRRSREVTLTQEVKLVNNLLTRFEFRRDYLE
jgi:hypothetical protein